MKISISNKKAISIGLMLVVFMGQSAIAKSIDDKQSNQKDRILQGVRSGELTAKEMFRLRKQQKSIYKRERRFKSDGSFTRQERAVIQRDLLRSSGSIYKQKHDRQMQGIHRAGLKSPRINARQQKQQRRINQGVRSGSLTRREVSKLGKQQARIQHKKKSFKADGHFTRREHLKVNRAQNRASKNIYRKKHNTQRR